MASGAVRPKAVRLFSTSRQLVPSAPLAGMVRQCAHDFPPWLFVRAVAEWRVLGAIARTGKEVLGLLPDVRWAYCPR